MNTEQTWNERESLVWWGREYSYDCPYASALEEAIRFWNETIIAEQSQFCYKSLTSEKLMVK